MNKLETCYLKATRFGETTVCERHGSLCTCQLRGAVGSQAACRHNTTERVTWGFFVQPFIRTVSPDALGDDTDRCWQFMLIVKIQASSIYSVLLESMLESRRVHECEHIFLRNRFEQPQQMFQRIKPFSSVLVLICASFGVQTKFNDYE